jgi:zinc protease
VDVVLAQLFSFGTGTLDRETFQKALDNIGANANAGTDFSLQVLAGNFNRGVELLADNELHPALPEKSLSIVRRQSADTVAGQIQSPDYLTVKALKSALFPAHDMALREPSRDSIMSLSLQDVRNYYNSVFRPDMTVIVVIGNITPEKARSVIEKYFGSWHSTGPKPDVLLPPVPPNKQVNITVPNSARVQDKVTLAETINLTREDPDYYALELGNHVLGGGFYATRLYQDLREKNGLVYFVSSAFKVGKTRSVYQVDYACDPSNVEKARLIIERNIKEMQSALVDPESLRLAKSMLLREIPLTESDFQSIAMGLIYRSELNLPLDEPSNAARQYIGLTAEQVRKAFAKWLRPQDLVQVTEGPPPH